MDTWAAELLLTMFKACWLQSLQRATLSDQKTVRTPGVMTGVTAGCVAWQHAAMR